MFQFTLRKLMAIAMSLALVTGLVGAVINKTHSYRSHFQAGDQEVVFESSKVAPRGTFFEFYSPSGERIARRSISPHPISTKRIRLCPFDPSGDVLAFFYDNPNPETLDLLFLVDLKKNAYAVYWGNCRADKCSTIQWPTWDQRKSAALARLQQSSFF